MKFVDQTTFHGDGQHGNCFYACVASFFNVPIDEQPEWHSFSETEWYLKFEDWVRERNFSIYRTTPNFAPECYYFALGKSSRGVGHAVIYFDGKLAHDPHPSREGLVEENDVWVFIPIDIGEFFK